MANTLKNLLDALPQIGEVVWIGVRPARKVPMKITNSIAASPEKGLEGDRYSGRTRTRQITLIQAEHLAVLESILGRGPVTPESLRRNVVVQGINLLALKNRDFSVGSVMLRATGLCHPCSRMETLLGTGGFNAMRGHGGITATVLVAGEMNIGDPVRLAK